MSKRKFANWDEAAMYAADKYERSVAAKKSKYAAKFQPKRVAPTVKKYVKKAIARAEETKVTTEPYASAITTVTAVNSGAAPIIFNLIPQLPNDTDGGSRIGTKVHPKKLVLQGSFIRRNAAATDAPLLVKLFIGRVKDNYDTPVLADFNQLFYGTNGAVTNASSLVKDTAYYPINTDAWDIKYVKTMLIGLADGSSTTSNNTAQSNYEINIDCTKYIKKTWRYTAGNNYPENDGLFAFIVPWTVDESTPAGVYQCAFNLTKSLRFSDA